jgi:adenylate kinase
MKLIYLSGAPASGKSTLLRNLKLMSENTLVFEYGKEMSARLSSLSKNSVQIEQAALRGGTENYVHQSDIDALDEEMTRWVDDNRDTSNLIIDSHHVTAENYGFRIAPFTPTKLARLNINEFWLIILSGKSTKKRIRADPEGRLLLNKFNFNFHTLVQSNLITTYAFYCGSPVYIFDGSTSPDKLAGQAYQRLQN